MIKAAVSSQVDERDSLTAIFKLVLLMLSLDYKWLYLFVPQIFIERSLETRHCVLQIMNKTERYSCYAVGGDSLQISSWDCFDYPRRAGNKVNSRNRMGDEDWELWEKANSCKTVTQECKTVVRLGMWWLFGHLRFVVTKVKKDKLMW